MRSFALVLTILLGHVSSGDETPPPVVDAKSQTDVLRPTEDLTVHRLAHRVEIRAWVCLDAGYLEQIACSPGTREHESLVVIRAKPSEIHASLLLAGLEPGSPGRWLFDPEDNTVELIQPQGPELDVLVRYKKDGEQVQHSVRKWIRDHRSGDAFPEQPWVFGGSAFRPNPEFMGPGEHYVADMTGSIIGLVTFGDEVIGLKTVISDQAEIHQPEWEVNTETILPEGTEVTIVLQPRKKDAAEPKPQQPADEAPQ